MTFDVETVGAAHGIRMGNDHQFLDWQANRLDCDEWRRWFLRRGVAHVVADGPLGWTIFKHLWNAKERRFCCGAVA